MKRYVLLFSIVISIGLLTTCKNPVSFAEYVGENFLAADSLTSEGWALMPDLDFTADSAGTAAADYMDFTATGATGPEGGPVYRLEIRNLLQNGDFEDGTVAPWRYFDGTSVLAPPVGKMEIISSGQEQIDGYTANIPDPPGINADERLQINLSTAFVNPATYLTGKNYYFNFDYRTNSLLYMLFPQWDSSTLGGELFLAQGGPDGTGDNQSILNRNTYPPVVPIQDQRNSNLILTSAAASDGLGFAGETQSGSFDNFRIVRGAEGNFDLRLRLKLNLDHRPDLTLIPGYYKLTLWVKQEDLTSKTNTFHADRVELGIKGYDLENQINVEEYKVFYKTQALADAYVTTTGTFPGDWTGSWVQLELASDKLIQLPNISQDPVLELTISPSNPGITDKSWNRLTAGTLLIADPALEYSGRPW